MYVMRCYDQEGNLVHRIETHRYVYGFRGGTSYMSSLQRLCWTAQDVLRASTQIRHIHIYDEQTGEIKFWHTKRKYTPRQRRRW